MFRVGGDPKPALRLGYQAIFLHETLYPAPPTANLLSAEFIMNSRTTVGLVTRIVNAANMNQEPLVLPRPIARLPSRPGVEPGTGYSKSPAHERDRKLALVGRDSCVPHRDYAAKYAAAFFKKSRSCLTTSSSRRRRRISSSWLGSLPFPGKRSVADLPSPSTMARSRQHRSIVSWIPRSRATWPIDLPLSSPSRSASSLN